MNTRTNHRKAQYWQSISIALIVALLSSGLSAQVVPAAPSTSQAASLAAPAAQPAPYDPAFQQVWSRTDQLVQATQVQRSFYWGFDVKPPFYERYDQGPDGKRLVRYFDKARMEINNPAGNKSDPFYVTNGLLSRELVTGRVQVGNDNFVQLAPAEVDIASDTDDTSPGTPTYASFRSLIRANPRQVGSPVSSTLNRAGTEGAEPAYATNFNVRYSYFEPVTQNNIPDIFWDFLNLTGPVIVNGQITNARLSDPYFYVTGYPISGSYWAKVKIAGKPNTDVLIQVYERRVLTYVPSAPAGWRVQMGNVGQHYFEWRYGSYAHGLAASCDAPSGKTGQLWFARPEAQKLGCGGSDMAEQGITIAHQRFEHGEMLDLINGRGYNLIYVLFADGTAQSYQDLYIGSDPEPTLNPPPGLYAPHAGFGKVWREGNLQARLGWALAPETTYAYDPKSEPPFPTPVPTAKRTYIRL